MSNSVFRQKSVDRVSSPEQLNDYIRVSSPGVWIILAAVIILLIGVFIWSAFGTVEMNTVQGTTKEIHPITFVTN